MHDIRDWAEGKHSVADDYPYGGGPGMVLKPEPVFAATEAVLELAPERGPGHRDDAGRAAVQPRRRRWSWPKESRLVILCGHYEGFDARVHEHLATDEISVGDYVLSGGEIPAMVVVDAVIRQLPGSLGCSESPRRVVRDGLLEAPHYTRPPEFRGWEVPEVLLSGHHAEVAKWRRRQNLLLTAQRRPDLLRGVPISKEEREWLAEQGMRPEDSAAEPQACPRLRPRIHSRELP